MEEFKEKTKLLKNTSKKLMDFKEEFIKEMRGELLDIASNNELIVRTSRDLVLFSPISFAIGKMASENVLKKFETIMPICGLAFTGIILAKSLYNARKASDELLYMLFNATTILEKINEFLEKLTFWSLINKNPIIDTGNLENVLQSLYSTLVFITPKENMPNLVKMSEKKTTTPFVEPKKKKWWQISANGWIGRWLYGEHIEALVRDLSLIGSWLAIANSELIFAIHDLECSYSNICQLKEEYKYYVQKIDTVAENKKVMNYINSNNVISIQHVKENQQKVLGKRIRNTKTYKTMIEFLEKVYFQAPSEKKPFDLNLDFLKPKAQKAQKYQLLKPVPMPKKSFSNDGFIDFLYTIRNALQSKDKEEKIITDILINDLFQDLIKMYGLLYFEPDLIGQQGGAAPCFTYSTADCPEEECENDTSEVWGGCKNKEKNIKSIKQLRSFAQQSFPDREVPIQPFTFKQQKEKEFNIRLIERPSSQLLQKFQKEIQQLHNKDLLFDNKLANIEENLKTVVPLELPNNKRARAIQTRPKFNFTKEPIHFNFGSK